MVKPKKKNGKPKKPRPRNPRALRRLDASGDGITARQILDENAKAWVNTMYDPFHPQAKGTRFPDLGTYPTTTFTVEDKYTAGSIADVNNTWSAFLIRPRLASHFQYPNAGTVNAMTFSNSNIRGYTAMASNFALYRCVAMGIRVQPTGRVLNREGTLFIGLVPPEAPYDDFDELADYETIEAWDYADLPEEGVMAYWLPLTQQGAANTTDMLPTGVTYRDPAETGLLDSALFVGVISDSGTADPPSISMNIEMISHWEAIPAYDVEYLFDQKVVVGSEESVAVALTEMGKQGQAATALETNKSSPGGTRHSGGILHTLSRGFKTGKTIYKKAKQVFSEVSGIASMVAPFFASSMRADLSKHRLALYAGVPSLSPKRRPALAKMSMAEFLALVVEAVNDKGKREESDEKSEYFKVPRLK